MQQGALENHYHHAGGHPLNPHVYLDTFVVLGSLGGQLAMEPKRWFALGTISASFLWFFGLALLPRLALRFTAYRQGAADHQYCGRRRHVVYRVSAGKDGVSHIRMRCSTKLVRWTFRCTR